MSLLAGRLISMRFDLRLGCWAFVLALLAVLALRCVGIAVEVDPRSSAHSSARAGAGALASLPPAAGAAVSRGLGASHRGYWATSERGSLHARNAPQRFTARFLPSGVVIGVRRARLGLGLRAIGRGTRMRAVAPVTPTATRNNVSYRHGDHVVEWYANGPLGLEQGFTLPTAPQRQRRAGLLTLSLALNTRGLRARLAHDKHDLTLTRYDGAVALRYHGLTVTDARGRQLHSWLELDDNDLLIRTNDANARYPLRIDPLVETAELTASDGENTDGLGISVAASGDTIVAGAPDATGNTDHSPLYKGAVYVFVKPATGWATATQVAELTASDGERQDWLGSSVAISGDTIVSSAPRATIGSQVNQGAVYVFVKPASGWRNTTETAKLTAADGAANDSFSSSVAISGDTIVSGDSGATIANKLYQGAAYVFVKPASGWKSTTETAKLTAADGAAGDSLGAAVAISGDTIVSGASNASINGQPGQGAVYVFSKPSSTWSNTTATAKLTAADGAAADSLGSSVAISDNTVVSGAPFATTDGNPLQGAAYVFVRPSSAWTSSTETAKLTASDGLQNSRMGASVAISNNVIVAGSPSFGVGPGTAYLFVKSAGNWTTATQTAKLTASDGIPNDKEGASVAISDDAVVSGTPNLLLYTDFTPQGRAYAFAILPVVDSGRPSDVSSSSASLVGSVNPQALAAVSDCHFDYGVTNAYGQQAPCAGQVGDAASPVTVSAQLGGLLPGTTYHYRLLATNAVGSGRGLDRTFTTLERPVVMTGDVSNPTQTSGELSGSVNPRNLPVLRCYFDYGTTDSYGSQAPCAQQAGSGPAPVAVFAQLTALSPGSTYHYRIVATNAAGPAYGEDRAFTTLLAPAVTTAPARDVTRTSATITGTVNPNNLALLDCHFDYGTTAAYGGQAVCRPQPDSGSSPLAVSANLAGLAPGVTYHYRLAASTQADTGAGADMSFTTVAPPPPPQETTATMQWAFQLDGSFTKVAALTVRGAPPQAAITVACHGHGCPYAKRVISAAYPRCSSSRCRKRSAARVILVNLAAPFHGRRLAPHAQITVEITKAGWIGKYYSFRTLNRRAPQVRIACLLPDTSKPSHNC